MGGVGTLCAIAHYRAALFKLYCWIKVDHCVVFPEDKILKSFSSVVIWEQVVQPQFVVFCLPNLKSTLEYSKSIAAVVDEHYPKR